jgi:TRAP-type C4-dicarboxylate transport system permease small subunit
MKNVAKSLMPLAVLVLFGTCLISVFGLLVVLMTSVGFADGVPLFYYQRLNAGVISVALPIVGIVLFTAILLRLPRKPAEAAKPTVIEGAAKLPVSEEGKKEEYLAKAA